MERNCYTIEELKQEFGFEDEEILVQLMAEEISECIKQEAYTVDELNELGFGGIDPNDIPVVIHNPEAVAILSEMLGNEIPPCPKCGAKVDMVDTKMELGEVACCPQCKWSELDEDVASTIPAVEDLPSMLSLGITFPADCKSIELPEMIFPQFDVDAEAENEKQISAARRGTLTFDNAEIMR